MQVRPARPGDARAVAEIHVRAWQAAYAAIVPAEYLASLSIEKHEALWSDGIAKGSPQLLVAVESQQVLGWVSFGPSRDDDASAGVGEVWAFYVAPSAWGSGVGKTLWSHMLPLLQRQGLRRITLWVFPENERAARFYRSLGFTLEPGSARQFTLGGVLLNEVRHVRDAAA
ncbi:MAG: GNAT family N-acetyltransferase [Burkholderiaceae bacterium]|nr:GNAT family N-acetyltransferase [Burkholderiaceae bacterium]